MGSVTGSTEVVEKVRKAEGDKKGKTRRGSRDAMVREAAEVNGSFSRETRDRAEVRLGAICLILLVKKSRDLKKLSLRRQRHSWSLHALQVGVQAGKPTLHHYLFDPTKDAVFEDPPER